MPFLRDADFVGRDAIRNVLGRKCAVAGSWTALVGLGGVGLVYEVFTGIVYGKGYVLLSLLFMQ